LNGEKKGSPSGLPFSAYSGVELQCSLSAACSAGNRWRHKTATDVLMNITLMMLARGTAGVNTKMRRNRKFPPRFDQACQCAPTNLLVQRSRQHAKLQGILMGPAPFPAPPRSPALPPRRAIPSMRSSGRSACAAKPEFWDKDAPGSVARCHRAPRP